jgi:signal transduction histidine kinase
MQISFKQLIQPVREEETPALTAYLHRSRQVGIRTGAGVLLLTLLTTLIAGAITQTLDVAHALTLALPAVALSLGLNFIHPRLPQHLRRYTHEAHSHLIMLFACWYGWLMPEALWFHFPQLSFFVLCGVLIFSPLPPSQFLRLCIANYAGHWIWYGLMIQPAEPRRALALLPLALGSAAALMLATQMLRHFWRHLEKSRQQLIAVDRLSTLGQHTAGIAHELNTPLSGALHANQGSGELLDELRESLGHPQVTQEDLREIVDELQLHHRQVASQLERSTRFVKALRESTQQMTHHASVSFHLREVMETTLLLLSYQQKKSGIAIHSGHIPTDCVLVGDPEKMGQVIGHLLANALEHHHKDELDRWVKVELQEHPGALHLIIEDNGPGVPANLREQVFEPLFTTRQDDHATGLGLSISRDIIQGVFGGELRLEETPSGARFVIQLPQQALASQPQLPPAHTPPQSGYSPFSRAQSRASASAQPAASSSV